MAHIEKQSPIPPLGLVFRGDFVPLQIYSVLSIWSFSFFSHCFSDYACNATVYSLTDSEIFVKNSFLAWSQTLSIFIVTAMFYKVAINTGLVKTESLLLRI